MVLENLIKKLMPKRQLTVDPELLTFLIQAQKEQTEHTVQHLRKGDIGLKLTTDNAYALYVHDAGNYQIRVISEGNLVDLKAAHFKKPGVYLLKPYIDFDAGLAMPINENQVALLGVPLIGITKFGSKNSYAAALALFSARVDRNKNLEDLFEKADALKKKRDALPEDKTDYWKEVFNSEYKKPTVGSRITKYVLGLAAAVLIASGARIYYEMKEDKLKRDGWQVEQETKRLAWENDYDRRKAIQEDQNTAESARQKEEAEKKRILAEEEKQRSEKFYRENLAKNKEIQTEMKNDLQKIIRETYKDAEVTDLVWEAYCSNPVIEKNGPNWSTTSFTVKFKDYTIRAHFGTDRKYDGPEPRAVTAIRTSIVKDGKAIDFYKNGAIDRISAKSEADMQFALGLVHKHNLTEVRKNIIDAVIEKQWHHRADTYNGR